MNQDIQIIAIGNAFELVYRRVETYSKLSRLAQVDESHFGQKATYWTTLHGDPDVVICTSAPSVVTLEATYEARRRPVFIEPKRASSSICQDLLADSRAANAFLAVLDRHKEIYLAPYVHTDQVERLAEFLLERGYSLVDFRRQADLVKVLWNKVYANRMVFDAVDHLRRHRPKSIVAHSEGNLAEALSDFKRQGIEKVVVKSSAAVGGAGVFFVNSGDANGNRHREYLVGIGQNEADRSLPFLIEERVHSDGSPTVDLEIRQTGEVEIVGIALQRLYDGRYYSGFYASSRLEERWWFKTVETLARVVGHKLADLGYLGPANVDFVVSLAEKRITLVEVNPRRSALIDGFSISKLKNNPLPNASISVADYVNVSRRLGSLSNVLKGLVRNSRLPGTVLPMTDGGFASDFRWVGILAVGNSVDSEDILEEAVLHLQDPQRDEIGIAEKQYQRISEKVA